MITFAELDENLLVKNVIVISEANNADENGDQDENVGIAFCKKIHGDNTVWRQAIGRRGEAHKGEQFYEDLDTFMIPQPFPSWTIVDNFWKSPIEEPTLTEEQISLGYIYYWDENVYQANSSEGWVIVVPQFVSVTEEPNDVTVSVGSSAIIGVGATVNKGALWGASFKKYMIIDPESGNDDRDWFYELNGIFDPEANNAVTGILTTTDYSGDYRVEILGDDGGVAITTSFTLTVTE